VKEAESQQTGSMIGIEFFFSQRLRQHNLLIFCSIFSLIQTICASQVKYNQTKEEGQKDDDFY
jgi:hypothetical protein